MLEAITDYEVIRLDRDGYVRSWSPGASRLKQYTEEEVLGHHVSMFYAEEDVRDGLAERELATAAREGRFEAEVVILDISGVPAIDTDVAQHLLKTVEAARLMGTASVLSGVRPETAQAIVHLGIELGTLRSRNSLRDALQLALQIVGGTAAE